MFFVDIFKYIVYFTLVLNELCQSFLISAGVLFNGDVPAGHNMINASQLKISLAQPVTRADASYTEAYGDFGAELQKMISTYEWLARLRGYKEEMPPKLIEFPDGFEEAVRLGVSTWYDGQITFVGPDENPDLTLFSIEVEKDHPTLSKGGTSNLPLYDLGGRQLGAESLIITVNLKDVDQESYSHLVAHEFGHSLGVKHPFDAARELNDIDSNYYLTSTASYTEVKGECGYFSEYKHAYPSIMGYGDRTIKMDDYDRGVKQIVKSGADPLRKSVFPVSAP